MELEWAQVLTQIVAFLLFLWILRRWAWGPLQKLLDERQARIAKEFEKIAEQKKEAAKALLEYQQKLKQLEKEAKAKVNEGVKEGERAARKIREEADKKAEERLQRAQREIEGEKLQAKDDLKKEMVALSFQLAEKILEQKTTPEQQQKWLNEFVQKAEIQ